MLTANEARVLTGLAYSPNLDVLLEKIETAILAAASQGRSSYDQDVSYLSDTNRKQLIAALRQHGYAAAARANHGRDGTSYHMQVIW